MKKLSDIKPTDLKKIGHTKLLLKNAHRIDQKLELSEDEQIKRIYVGKTFYIFTNLKVYVYFKNTIKSIALDEVAIEPSIMSDQFMITAGGKIDHVFLSWWAETENSILPNTMLSPIKLVEKLFPKLEHTPIFFGFRLNQHIIYLNSILDTTEEVIYFFTGLAKNWNSNTVACALTTKDTLIFASKPVIGEKNKRISISDIKEVTVISELVTNVVVFETFTEKFAILVGSSQNSNEISKIVRSYIANYKTEKNKSEINYSSKPISVADELIKFKQLLDAGILSQEDFEKMKDKLLK